MHVNKAHPLMFSISMLKTISMQPYYFKSLCYTVLKGTVSPDYICLKWYGSIGLG
jgi:hypothetical protein